MSRAPDPALELARRLAAGEAIDPAALAGADPALAAGLTRLAAIRRALAGEYDAGRCWGHLQRLEPAGHGSFGEVFRAFDPTLDRTVALKLRRADLEMGLAGGRDFVAEARRLARVRHPHVLAVHGASFHDGRAGLWADWIDGETLHARLTRESRLPLESALRLAAELASALAAVHEAGIVHGDVKATNVMLDSRGHSVLMDFGAGFTTDEESRLTRGTPRYLAPEVMRGETVGTAVDVYALGVLLHLAASGDFPGPDGAPSGALPRALRLLLAAMLAPQPSQRPTAAAIVAAIATLQRAPLARARRLARAALIAALAGGAISATIAWWQVEQQRRDTEAALTRARATAEFLADLLGAASPEDLGPRATLRELLDLAPARIEQRLNLAAEERSALLQSLAHIEAGMANDEAAAGLAENAWRMASALQPEADHVLLLQADALRLRAIAGDAEAALMQAERLLQRARDETRPQPVQAEIELALAEAEFRVSLRRSEPGLTERIAHRIERLLAAPSLLDARRRVEALRRLSALRVQLGEVEAAVHLGEAAVALSDAEFGPADPITALSRRILGWMLMEVGDAERSEAQFRTNLALHADKLGERSRAVCDDKTGLAYALVTQQRHREALPVAREAWALANALYPGAHRATIDAGLTLVAALAPTGGGDEADALLLELRARLVAAHGRDNRQYLLVTRELALQRRRRGDATATALLHECVQRGTAAFGPGYPIVLDCERLLRESPPPEAD